MAPISSYVRSDVEFDQLATRIGLLTVLGEGMAEYHRYEGPDHEEGDGKCHDQYEDDDYRPGHGFSLARHIPEIPLPRGSRPRDQGIFGPISVGPVSDRMTHQTESSDPSDRSDRTRQLHIDRRTMLVAGLGGLGIVGSAALLAACGGSDDTVPLTQTQTAQLVPLFPRDVAYIAAGVPARLIFTVTDDEGVPRSDLPEKVTFTIRQDDQQVGEPVEAIRRDEDIPRPYLGFTFTFPDKGVYDVYATVDDQDLNTPLIVMDPDEVKMPVIGQPLPPAATATEEESLDVDPICTLVPQCPFHEHNLEDVLGTGKPVVVLLATPAYCQTTACGPILENLMAEAGSLADDVIVIHSEVYEDAAVVDDLNDATLAPLPLAYNMAFEPALFVTDSKGILVGRGDIAVDRAEMRELLALAR